MAACRSFRRLLSRDMDGELGAEDRAVLEAHLVRCDPCRAERRLWLRIREILVDTDVPADVLEEGVRARVLDGIRRHHLRAGRLVRFTRKLAAAAAILVFASVALLLATTREEAPLAREPGADLGRVLFLEHLPPAPPADPLPDERGSNR
jgi:anti-sigma factor RsiW